MDTSEKNSDFLFDNSSDEESSDGVTYYERQRADKRYHEEDGDYSVRKLRNINLELIKPSTSKKDHYLLGASSNEENSDEVTRFQQLKIGKRFHKENKDDFVKGKINEELEFIQQPSTSEMGSNTYNSSGLKTSLHGVTYQLRLLMLFVQRVPDEQEFFLSTEMSEAGVFDDIVLKYLQDDVWRCRFLQAKHKNDNNYKIKKSDLFDTSKIKKTSQSSSSKPYLLKKYFESYCATEKNPFFNNADLEEFLICSNVGFAQNALPYFECTEDNDDDPILGNRVDFEEIPDKGTNPDKFRLNQEKLHELKKEFAINNQNETSFSNFVSKFRFLVNYDDNELNKNIQNCLKNYLKIENVNLPVAYLQSRILKWFENYKDKKSEYFRIKDKKEFLESLNNNIESLMVTGISTSYTEKLESFGVQFENILPLREFICQIKDNIMFLITASPKLSIIKLSQVFNALKLSRDEVILINADKLRYNKKIFPIFFSEPTFRWLVIESHNTIQLSKELLDNIFKMDNKKTVVIIGREDGVLNFNKSSRLKTSFDDENTSFNDLMMDSQKDVLKKQVLFQGKKISLNELIDINSGSKTIDELTLEKLLTKYVKIGDHKALISDFLIKDCYIPRKLIEKELNISILQNEELLNACLFFIPGVSRDDFNDLNINDKWIFMWEGRNIFTNGIILSKQSNSKDIFNELCTNNTKNVCWLKHANGKFSIMNIRHYTGILDKHIVFLEEDDLNNKKILEKKIRIVADGHGGGKSTFMTKVARQLKKIMSNIWVFRINLSSYACTQQYNKKFSKSLEDITFEDNETKRATEFIFELLFPQEYKKQNEHFVRKLFTNSLYPNNKNTKFPNVILLFDGFDEISPQFKDKTLTLLKALQNSNVTQMWITTRKHEEHTLEKALHSSSFFLNPLDNEEKINFLNNFWRCSLMNFNDMKPKTYDEGVLKYFKEIKINIHSIFHTQDLLVDFEVNNSNLERLPSSCNFLETAKRLIDNLEKKNIDKLSDFTDNPLHLKMMAEIIFIDKFRALENLEIYSLYDDFIKYKWTFLSKDKNAAGNSNIGEKFYENYLKVLTKDHQKIAYENLFCRPANRQSREESDNIFLSIAGLLVIHGDHLEFVHRSFTEYFASQYFAENFHDKDIQKLVFSVILIEKGNSLIRKFLNKNEAFLNKLGSKTQQMVDMIGSNCSDLQILYQMVEEGVHDLFVKFLENLPCDFLKNAILFNGNDKRRTVMHEICDGIEDLLILQNVLKAVKDSVSEETFNELLLKTDIKLQTVSIFSKDKLIMKEKLNFFKINCNSRLFHELLLQADEDGKTTLHIACEFGPDITHLMDVADENKESLNRLLLKTDNRGLTALHYAIFESKNPSLVTALCNLIKSVCSTKEIKYLFEMERSHAASIQDNEDILSNFLIAIKDNSEILTELLLKTDND